MADGLGINRICSGVSGLGDDYIALMHRPGWKQMPGPACGTVLNVLIDGPQLNTCKVCGQQWLPRNPGSSATICPRCKAERRRQMSERCVDNMDERAARRRARRAAR